MRTRFMWQGDGCVFAFARFLRKFCFPTLLLAVLVSSQAALVREPNVTMQLPGQSPPFSYVLENIFPALEFKDPIVVVPSPSDNNKLFVVEQGGRIILINNLDSPTKTVFLDISERVAFGTPEGEGGLLGFAFHPNYAANGHIFVFYVCTTSTADGSGRHDRLSRFTRAAGDPNRINPGSEVVLFTQFDQEFNHNAGSLFFGPDGYLYLTVGDEGYPNDVFNNSQRIDRDFFGGVLRIDVDKKSGNLAPNPHPALGGAANYSIPKDNPFVGATSFNGLPVDSGKVRTEFWAVGLRSPWRMFYDGPTGNIYVSDVGEIGNPGNGRSEEINLIVRGGNYGWPYFEADGPGPKQNEMPAGFQKIDPLITYDRGNSGPTVGRAAIGGVVYRGARFPELNGAYIFGDYFSGNIWKLRHSGNTRTEWDLVMSASQGHIVSFALDPRNGDVLVCDVVDDQVKRLSAVPGHMMPPATLAQAGVFADLQTLQPNPGIVPYDINVPFWSDGAAKQRWFSIPDVNEKMTYSANGNWDFPPGTVWIKHFELNERRVETRLLVRTETGTWGASYEWDDAGANAFLVDSQGKDKAIDGQVWHFPGRNECASCHTPVAGHAIGFNTAQMNRSFNYGGGAENQIRALARAGYFRNAAGGGKALVPAHNNGAGLAARVKSYLAANCAQCHQPNGPARTLWDARYSTPMARAGIVNGAALNNFGNPAYRIIAPKSPENSMLLQRMQSLDHTFRMPPLASTVVDTEGVDLITRWIMSLPARKQPLRVRVAFPRGAAARQDVITIGGTATGDNLAKVVYTLNDGGEQEASGTSQWSAEIQLQPGVNRVQVYAVDGEANKSRPARRLFRYIP